jgi:hypothetical protein
MDVKKLLLASLAVGVVANVFDFVVQGQLLAGYYSSLTLLNREPPIPWLVFGDFVAALVFVWVYACSGASAEDQRVGRPSASTRESSSTFRHGSSPTSCSWASRTPSRGRGR